MKRRWVTGKPQVGDARLEVVLETGERARQEIGVVGANAARQLARDRPRRRLIAGGDARLELRPQVGRDLGREVAHAVRQAALARRARKAFLDRPDDPRRTVGDDQQRIAEPAGAQVLKERPHRLDVLLGARHQRQQDLASVLADAPGGQHRLAPLTWPKPLGDAVDEQVDDGVLGKIALAEVLIFGPQPLGDLAHRRPRQKPSGPSRR